MAKKKNQASMLTAILSLKRTHLLFSSRTWTAPALESKAGNCTIVLFQDRATLCSLAVLELAL